MRKEVIETQAEKSKELWEIIENWANENGLSDLEMVSYVQSVHTFMLECLKDHGIEFIETIDKRKTEGLN